MSRIPSQSPSVEERRKEKRYKVKDQQPLTATSGGRIYTCYIEEISLSGVRLRFEGSMPSGNAIALDHPTAGTLCGICTWRDTHTMGVELQFPHGDLERILRCVCLIL